MTAEEYFDAATRALSHACERVGASEHELTIAGAAVRLRFAGTELERFVLPPLAHLETSGSPRDPALTIALFDSRSTGVDIPRFPWAPGDLGIQGEVTGHDAGAVRIALVEAADVLYLYNASRRTGLCWVADPATVPSWEWNAPLRTIIHWWSVPTSRLPVHAGSVGRNGRGVLVAGASGAGKSTTALACLEAGLDYVGDDYVLVDVEAETAHTLYQTAKLEPSNLERFPGLVSSVTNAERLDGEKALVSVHNYRPQQLASALELTAIVLPRVGGAPESRLVVTSPAAALRVLTPTTAAHLPGAHREVFTKLNRLVRTLPCFDLEAGTDLVGLAEVVAASLPE